MYPHYSFPGRTAIVTGGSNGIGRAIAERLIAAEADVYVWDLVEPEFEGASFARVDVTDPASISDAIDLADERVDMLVNNAGFAGPTLPLDDYDPTVWRQIIDVNLIGVYEVCRQVVPLMRREGWGRIVNIASLAGKEGTPNASAYSAAKGGVIAMTKSMGKELAMTDIRVNALAPAAVETDILSQMAPEHVQTMINKSPMQRLGQPDEVAETVMWLLSAATSFSTGAVFDLSGGRATY